MYPTLNKLFRLCDEVNDVQTPGNAPEFSERIAAHAEYLESCGVPVASLPDIEIAAARLSEEHLRLMANGYASASIARRAVAKAKNAESVKNLADCMFDLLNEGPPCW